MVINALNKIRNDLLEEQRPTDIVDEVLLKTIDAPVKRYGAGMKQDNRQTQLILCLFGIFLWYGWGC